MQHPHPADASSRKPDPSAAHAEHPAPPHTTEDNAAANSTGADAHPTPPPEPERATVAPPGPPLRRGKAHGACPNPNGGPAGPWTDVPEDDWNRWTWQQANRLRRLDDIDRALHLTDDERDAFVRSANLFDVAVTPYYASLMRTGDPRCPIRLQSLPQKGELAHFPFELDDPLAEEEHMPVPGITYRYPDRILFYVTHNCPVYCRHCTRKRKVADPGSAAARLQIEEGLRWIARTTTVRDVLLSGGDPLTLSDDRLLDLLHRLADIPHVEVIRLGTRNPVTLPQRFTPELCQRLRDVRPLYVHTHFNHPAECSAAAATALERLADAGCVLGNQMVLLRGVNDDPATVLELNRWLLRHRCRPYYIFQADMARGITHFRTPLQRGLDIIEHLRGRIGGMGVPHFAIDLPGGGGKITLTPEHVVHRDGNHWTFRNTFGRTFSFVDAGALEDDP
ncbi:MAG: KamA family radical SAM protein [Deltaproteobacteria bacterium]|nr:MAG: KamA family radical SAM protein [Deltaproteobacteria bacterium]